MTQINKNARARRRAQRERVAALEAVTARLLGTTTGRASRSHDDLMDAYKNSVHWSPEEIGRMQLSDLSSWAAGDALVMNKINGLRADSAVVDEIGNSP